LQLPVRWESRLVTLVAADPVSEAREALAAVFSSERTFDAWYERALPRVYGYVFSRCGHDADVAEEITQLAFVAAVRARSTFDGRSDPVTWVCGIARHKLADHFRRLDSEERARLRLVEGMEEPQAPDGSNATDERRAIAEALASLPAMYRAVLMFTVLDGLTVRQAAELLGRSESATESLLHRARTSFKRAYRLQGGLSDV
jgi:RNA polymerase sigma-70 factor (ECF subfamily)